MQPIQNNETNNMDIEEGRINHGASAVQPTAIDQSEGSTNTNTDNTNTSLATLSSGLQLMDDDDNDDLPLPMGMAEVISNAAEPPKQKIGKVEQLDDNDVGPEPPIAMLEASLNAADNQIASKVAADISNNLASVNETSPPVPFNYAQFQAATDNIPDNKSDLINQLAPPTSFHPHNVPDNKVLDINQLSPPVPFNFTEYEREDDDDVIKMNAKALTNQMPVVVSTSQVEPIQNVGSNHLPTITPSEQSEIDPPPPPSVSGNHNQVPDIIRRPPPPSMLLDPFRVSDPSNITSELVLETATVENAAVGGVVDASVEHDETKILEAYAVDDDIYGATPLEPTLPWWKQRRTKILLGLILVIVGTLAIVLGVELSQPEPEPVTNTIMISNSNTTAPSVSLIPSSSSAPSSSPTECVNKIMSNAQTIDLKKDLQTDDLRELKVAVDGRNMVVVVKDGKYYTDKGFGNYVYDGPVFVLFYSLVNAEDKWRILQTPIRVNDVSDNVYSEYSVAVSGNTAFIGFEDANDRAGVVFVYEQDRFGEWERVDDPFVHTSNTTQKHFGSGVDVDGDLACVRDGSISYDTSVHLYHQDDSKWVQFDTVDGRDCSISGDTIAVRRGLSDWSIQLYKYNQEQNKVVPIQDPISTGSIWSMDLSNTYLVYQEHGTAAFIYHRDKMNQTFNLQQQLNITGLWDNQLALDNDILVVGGYNQTHIYSLQDGNWEETIALDETYDDIIISGRTLLTTKYNETLSSSDIYTFNIQTCTQAAPTQTPSMSISPSTETPTVTCDWIQVIVSTETIKWEARWEMHRLDDVDDILVESGTITDEGIDNYIESICLQEGRYKFTITGSGSNSDCSFGKDDYNITTANGVLIEGEKESYAGSEVTWCDWAELTPFSFAYAAEPSTSASTTNPFSTDPQGPVARPDSANLSTSEDNMIFVSVLDNDTPAVGKILDVNSIISDASNGQCGISIDLQEVVYIPNQGFTGFDTCVYEACDGVPACDTATLTITITSTSESTTTTYSPVTAPLTLTTTESTSITTTPTNTKTTACLTQVECEEQIQKGYANFYTGSYADYGCFSKNNNIFWGVGGTDAQNAIISLNNNKERVWCS